MTVPPDTIVNAPMVLPGRTQVIFAPLPPPTVVKETVGALR